MLLTDKGTVEIRNKVSDEFRGDRFREIVMYIYYNNYNNQNIGWFMFRLNSICYLYSINDIIKTTD